MTSPEDALRTARERAAAVRESGGYAQDLSGFEVVPVDECDPGKLVEWSVIEPRDDAFYSTRPGGGAITAVKRLLAKLMRQQSVQLASDQTRFNLHMAAYVARLEERIAELEAEARELRKHA